MKHFMVEYDSLSDCTDKTLVEAETAAEAEKKIKPYAWRIISVTEVYWTKTVYGYSAWL